jgi:hypothetical protein
MTHIFFGTNIIKGALINTGFLDFVQSFVRNSINRKHNVLEIGSVSLLR